MREISTADVHWFPHAHPSRWKHLGWVALTLALCAHFALCYSTLPDFLKLDVYTDGLAATPYQYRVLPMFLFRLLANRAWLVYLASHGPHGNLREPHNFIQVCLCFISMFGTVLASFSTLTWLTGDREFSRWFSLLAVYMAYFNLATPWGLAYTLPYDTPSLLFFSLGVLLIVRDRVLPFYVLFPLAVLNRETIIFLTVYFVCWRWVQLPRNRKTWLQLMPLAIHAAVQFTIWFLIKRWLTHRFAANPVDLAPMFSATLFRAKIALNLRFLAEPSQWPVLLSCFGFLLPAVWIGRDWIRHRGVALGCAVVVPLWFAGMMMVGVIIELRVFSELTAFVLPALGLIVHHRFRPVAA